MQPRLSYGPAGILRTPGDCDAPPVGYNANHAGLKQTMSAALLLHIANEIRPVCYHAFTCKPLFNHAGLYTALLNYDLNAA